MKATKEQAYRGFFTTASGALVTLDFYADTRGLAYDHAFMLAQDAAMHESVGRLTLVKVRRLAADDVYDAGSFRRV